DDRGVDAVLDQFRGVAFGEGVHRGLGGEVRAEERGVAAAGGGRSDPHQVPAAAGTQRGQHGAVDALGREHVDVVELGELVGGEGFGGAEDHVAGVVHHDVEVAVPVQDVGDGRVH